MRTVSGREGNNATGSSSKYKILILTLKILEINWINWILLGKQVNVPLLSMYFFVFFVLQEDPGQIFMYFLTLFVIVHSKALHLSVYCWYLSDIEHFVHFSLIFLLLLWIRMIT